MQHSRRPTRASRNPSKTHWTSNTRSSWSPAHTATRSRSAWSSRRNSGNAQAGTAGRTASRGHSTGPPGTFAVEKIIGKSYSRLGGRDQVPTDSSPLPRGGLACRSIQAPFSFIGVDPRLAPLPKSTFNPRPATKAPAVRLCRRAWVCERRGGTEMPGFPLLNEDSSGRPDTAGRSGRGWRVDGGACGDRNEAVCRLPPK